MSELFGTLKRIGAEWYMKENHHSQLVPLAVLSPIPENDTCHSLQAHRTNATKGFKKQKWKHNKLPKNILPSLNLKREKTHFIPLTTAHKLKLWCNYKLTKVFFFSVLQFSVLALSLFSSTESLVLYFLPHFQR